MLHAVDLFQPLFLQPLVDFIIGHDRRPGALRDRDGVADVVAVAVRHQDEVGLGLVGLDGQRPGCR